MECDDSAAVSRECGSVCNEWHREREFRGWSQRVREREREREREVHGQTSARWWCTCFCDPYTLGTHFDYLALGVHLYMVPHYIRTYRVHGRWLHVYVSRAVRKHEGGALGRYSSYAWITLISIRSMTLPPFSLSLFRGNSSRVYSLFFGRLRVLF